MFSLKPFGGGPQDSKKVLKELEAELAKCVEQTPVDSGERISISPPEEQPVLDKKEHSIVDAVFSIGSIEKFGVNYRFIDLQVPEGHWEELVLAGKQFENGAKLSHPQWVQYSNGTHGFNPKKEFVQLPKPVSCEFKLLPCSVRYWLMRATYESKDKPNHSSVVAELQQLFYQDDHNPWQHNAELIKYRANQKALVQVLGWPANHPFSVKKEIALAGNSPVTITARCKLKLVLQQLIDDSDPQKVKTVMEYHDKPTTNKTLLWRCNTNSNDERVLVLGVNINVNTIINCNYSTNIDRPARGVAVEQKKYHPRGV